MLEKNDVTPMPVKVGQEFDPKMHEAIAQDKHQRYKSGEIIEVVRKGYLWRDQVLRAAQVRIATDSPDLLEVIEAMLQNLDPQTQKEFRRLVGRCLGDRKQAIRMIAEQYERNPSASIRELIKEVHRLWDRDDGVI